MKKLSLVLILLISFILPINIVASETGTMSEGGEIKGKVIDTETDEPLEYATVSLFHSQDSTLVTGVITDSKGLFSLKAKPGKYYVVVQFMGYKDKTLNVNIKDNKTVVSLGEILMNTDAALLDEVEIVAEKSTLPAPADPSWSLPGFGCRRP